MHVDKDTKICRKATMFLDGAEGAFGQEYDLSFAVPTEGNDEEYDNVDAGVHMSVAGNVRKDNTKTIFLTKNGEFDELLDALEDAGHTIEESLRHELKD